MVGEQHPPLDLVTLTENADSVSAHIEDAGHLEPGQVLAGRYRIRSQLGFGGMGVVWRASDLKLRVEVALKTLRGDHLKKERHVERLRQEVTSAHAVVSPNVCRIFDLVDQGQTMLFHFSSDGERLLTSTETVHEQLAGFELAIRSWPVSGGEPEVLADLEVPPSSTNWGPNGSFVVTACRQGRIAVVSLAGEPVRVLKGFTDLIAAIAVSPSSNRVAAGAGSYIREQALVRIWDLKSGKTLILDVGNGEPIRRLHFEDETTLWATGISTIRHWDLSRQEVVEEFPSLVESCTTSTRKAAAP